MTDKTKIKMPEWLEIWTADEVAECFYPGGCDKLYAKLWEFVCEAEDAKQDADSQVTAENAGTISWVDINAWDSGVKGPQWWSRLNAAEQQMIIDAYDAEYPND